jgi:hypothetical protein
MKLPNITNWKHATLTVSSLVANCHILVLGVEDFIEFKIDGMKIREQGEENYTTVQSAKK